jgi:uncharacterized membrane protein YedE/YeeE
MQKSPTSLASNWPFLLTGMFFGLVFVKGEIISWFRMQEMFRLQSFHMYGVIGSAVITAMISLQLIKWKKGRSLSGELMQIPPKEFNKGTIIGGLCFGLGWGITGACPGPLYAQIGSGSTVTIITLLSAITGTWLYGRFKHKLPH